MLDSGFVYLFQGGTNYTGADQGEAVLPLNPSTLPLADNFFGTWVNVIGDVDNDGIDDFMAGAPGGNNSSNVKAGVAGITTSTGAQVSIPQLRLHQASRPDGRVVLSFTGFVVMADAAELWSVSSSPQRLAALGDGMTLSDDALSVTLAAEVLAGLETVELRWEANGYERSDRFALAKVPAPRFVLHDPIPNPFNPTTVIVFELPASMSYDLRVVDGRGRVVRHLATEVAGPGRLEMPFDGRDDRGRILASGAYTVVLQSGRQVRTVRAILLK
jgi:hypothetical protein